MNLKEVVFGTRRERVYTEGQDMGGIICPLIKMNHWDVFIYGGGQHIEALVMYLWSLKIEIKGILDCDINKAGKKVLDQVPIINPSKITQKYNPDKTFVIINTIYFRGIEQYEIMKLLSEIGITKYYELNECEKAEIRAKPHSWADVGRIEYYRENCEELEKVYDMFQDNRSKETMLEFIRTYMQYGTYRLKQCSSDVKYLYGQNEDGSKEELYKHLENEVWINCGSNNGDNIFWYFANDLKAQKIYAYESDKKVYKRLVKNLQYLPKEQREKVQPINEFISSETNWEILRPNHVTLINADIEGGELDLLKSMKDVIVSDRPVIAICAYHKADDLIELPQYIRHIVSDYCFVLRKYESNIENVRRTAELVLYAIPKERMSNEIMKE